MKIAPAAVLCLSLLAAVATSEEVSTVRKRALRNGRTPPSNFVEETTDEQDAAFWERELGKNGSGKGKGGKGGSKGGSKSKSGKGKGKGKGKGHRELETVFTNEQEQEDIEFWDRQ
eukprot:CAMPEP_0197433210 /NCGR_PEP_ID=MMETSP1175-20131217/1146_1 /TAXON_ID=1003142 /ORGANISM="Triceratium dubium, Strain CCMP147" /LENGTH=115 /DNA_ID=CAMNT_0042961519 /DNA_START=20 /DNA_END=364 /DNA_ORIENTATION=+